MQEDSPREFAVVHDSTINDIRIDVVSSADRMSLIAYRWSIMRRVFSCRKADREREKRKEKMDIFNKRMKRDTSCNITYDLRLTCNS